MMGAIVHQRILIVMGLVVQAKLTFAAHCSISGNIDASELHNDIAYIAAEDIALAYPSVGNVHTTISHGIPSNGAKCQKTHDALKVLPYANEQGNTLNRGSSTCNLKAIVLRKTGSETASMYFDYENCTGIPTKATVEIALEKVTAETSDVVFDFFDEVCGLKEFEGYQLTAKVALDATEVFVGNGVCNGILSAKYQNIAARSACRQLCVADMVKYANLPEKQAMKMADICRGYAYSAATQTCMTYRQNAILNVTDSSDNSNDWTCKATVLEHQTYGEKRGSTTTPMPKPMLKLSLDKYAVFGTVQTYQSKERCFPGFDWISLQDHSAKKVSLKIKDVEWNKLMNLIPSSSKSLRQLRSSWVSPSILATVKLDRVQYGAGDAAKLPPQTTHVPAQAVVTTEIPITAESKVQVATNRATPRDCVIAQIGNALTAGALVPVIVWGTLFVLYNRVFKIKTAGVGPSYEQFDCSSGDQRKQIVYRLIIASLPVAAIVSYLLVSLLALIFKSICDSSSHDMTPITVSAGMSTICGCTISLYFLSTRMHDAIFAKKEQKFMMVAVDEDGTHRAIKQHEMVDEKEHHATVNLLSTRGK